MISYFKYCNFLLHFLQSLQQKQFCFCRIMYVILLTFEENLHRNRPTNGRKIKANTAIIWKSIFEMIYIKTHYVWHERKDTRGGLEKSI